MAGKTLSASKPILQLDIRKCLQKAAYEAMIQNIESSDSDPAIVNKAEQEMKKAATKFANTFADEASGPLADAIYKFTSEIAIMAVPKGTLISAAPGSPVAGVININDFIVT